MTEVMRLARVRQLSCYVTSIHTLVAYGVSSSHFLLSKVAMLKEAKSRRARLLLKVMKSQNEYRSRELKSRNWVKSRTWDLFIASKFKFIYCDLWRKSTDIS